MVSQTRCTISDRRLGQILLVAGAGVFASSNAVLKMMQDRGMSSMFATLAFRALQTCLCNSAIVFFRKGASGLKRTWLGLPEREKERDAEQPSCTDSCGFLIYLRGAAFCCQLFMLLASFTFYLTFAEAFAIFLASVTVATNVFAVVLLCEPVQIVVLSGAFVSISGILLVSKPEFLLQAFVRIGWLHREGLASGSDYASGVPLAVFAGLCGAMVMVLTRVLKNRSPETLLQGYMLMLLIASSCVLAVNLLWPSASALQWGEKEEGTPHFPQTVLGWVALVGYSVGTQAGQVMQGAGLSRESASVGSSLTATEVFFAFLADVLILGEAVDSMSCVGALLVFSGAAIAASGKGSGTESSSEKEAEPETDDGEAPYERIQTPAKGKRGRETQYMSVDRAAERRESVGKQEDHNGGREGEEREEERNDDLEEGVSFGFESVEDTSERGLGETRGGINTRAGDGREALQQVRMERMEINERSQSPVIPGGGNSFWWKGGKGNGGRIWAKRHSRTSSFPFFALQSSDLQRGEETEEVKS
uniref:EamA domain-containing protein n=1 Tax=Chromera velia CCMP2878 TaxID=1169474 RepID=A0A0G4FUL4_9ALVE|eukprot:Cvel_18838.t1-p1 / transcript=Cvel_18838.t1 / gene=Cvel_18838 / organism=Chromera_velia_CCMP2878 / gene_product=hypothetical protein / transcript_product=hypothetical protein / location=Cvel_scaffold1583:31059-32780(-) / protein_length=533 / sequence_SO=supercontig / SO=protein_coding / is_pseudo=false